MSWGEESCVHYGACPAQCTPTACNVECDCYEWDGLRSPIPEVVRGVMDDELKRGYLQVRSQKPNLAQQEGDWV